jgi:phosphoribosylaminoimidazolecarboxamide formyltransferase/IMP cyclohydrolase
MEKYALLSVSDKSGLETFASFIAKKGYKLLSTGGTASYLKEKGLEVISISDFTGYPEILDGRVKSLHPKIHGGILARMDREQDRKDLASIETGQIEFVVVNLYPFTQEVEKIEAARKTDHGSLIELIDIGGPTLLRAAAKNCYFVAPICDPTDYPKILAELTKKDSLSLEMRRELAKKVFLHTAKYDAAIARYFSVGEELLEKNGEKKQLTEVESLTLTRKISLRYGENPHQQAALYSKGDSPQIWEQLQGKELSYNNLLDMNAALELLIDLEEVFPKKSAAVIIKHSNPCGASIRADNLSAFIAARECDPVSAFGGIVAVSGVVSKALAESIIEGFVEIVVACGFDEEAKQVFAQKKNIRVLECDWKRLTSYLKSSRLVYRECLSDIVVQTADRAGFDEEKLKLVTGEKSSSDVDDLKFAWILCKHVKSNAIILVKALQAIGVGAGQMSRVDSSRVALDRARANKFDLSGAVAASDAFLPFSDTLCILNDEGVTTLIQPGGSMRDEEVIAEAKRRNVQMYFTGERHFRH